MRRFLIAAAAVTALTLASTPAQAQRYRYRVPGVGGTLNPYNYYDPYGYSRQAAFNLALYGRAMSQVPPYALGYNPYPPVINYYSPVVPYGYSYPTPYYGYYATPYSSGYSYYYWP